MEYISMKNIYQLADINMNINVYVYTYQPVI